MTAALALAALAALAAREVYARRHLAVRHRVIVSTVTGDGFDAILWARRGRWLILRDATLLSEGNRVPVDGDVILDRANVLFIQAPGGRR